MLADEVHDAPAVIALLDVLQRKRRRLRPAQPAAQQGSQHRAVAQPLFVDMSGAFKSVCACRTDSQFPTRTPFGLAPFTRVIPAANSGASRPLSAASTASFRTAVIRTLMEMGPSPWASSAIRQAPTVAFVKPYVKGQNSAAQDAAAICEAASRPEMRFAPQRLIGQQELQALHRIRIHLISVTGRS